MKKVELLAPAGNYQSFLAAINAGADAVYLAGNKFGARAYADNFSENEVCEAIKYAHLFGRKVYLTVNILLKDTELATLYEYILPFYHAGLDGVIIQDLGVFSLLKEHFPGLELHASTQMALTGVYGAKYLKQLGASRIVPARELSLEEIRDIKSQVDIEIEAFVHGAECYCYSGLCLMSSILGGRSGNRGRCAQPCRLPYQALCDGKKVTEHEQYLLSLKDMCTIRIIPKLIESGIDSFKIEGRMKSPEYAAGVTSIYRKYIDLYYQDKEHYHVANEDMNLIKNLYIRSEIQEGYYQKYNGKEMVTLSKPSYSGSDDKILNFIRQKYMASTRKLELNALVKLYIGKPLECTVTDICSGISVTVSGNIIEEATNKPVLADDVRRQLNKTGNTNFIFHNIELKQDPNVFISLKSINEIRRDALDKLENRLIQKERNPISDIIIQNNLKTVTSETVESGFQVTIDNLKQFEAALLYSDVKTLIIPIDLLLLKKGIQNKRQLFAYFVEKAKAYHKTIVFSFPFILRKRSYEYLEEITFLLEDSSIDAIMIRNLESLQWLKDHNFYGKIIADAQLYSFNQVSKNFLLSYVDEVTIPYELNYKELLHLGLQHTTVPVYGRIPMMVTANCIRKTAVECCNDIEISNEHPLLLEDRYHKNFYIKTNCLHCYNVIYNGQPTSLHSYVGKLLQNQVEHLRLDFTNETVNEMKKVLDFFIQIYNDPDKKLMPPYKEFTKGHLARGVE